MLLAQQRTRVSPLVIFESGEAQPSRWNGFSSAWHAGPSAA